MDLARMRAADRWLGRPLCAALTLVRRLLPAPGPKPPAEVRRVLFVKLSEMGALVLSAPAFAEARRVFPNAEVHLLCFSENAELAGVAGGIPPDRRIEVRPGGVLATIGGLLGAIREARRRRFDVVVDLEYFSRVSAILSFLTRAPVRAGYHRFEAEGLYQGDLYTHRASWNLYLHVSQSYVALVRAAAADPRATPLLKAEAPPLADLVFPRFEPTDADVSAAADVLRAAGVPDGARVLLVNPNSSDLLPLRRWPEERFTALCRALADAHPDAWIVLTGAGHEAEVAERIRAASGTSRCVSIVGRTGLRALLAVFRRASVLVSADSGPPHFAAMTDLRCVTLFGPETPQLYGPVTSRNTAITAGLACSPCIHAWNRRVSTCTDNQCMQRIDVARVVAAVSAAVAG
ncbi:MAG: hypothetical protein HMLKMBBP_01180 [Planctomycetes bacterium]|nr:hypothetical protein [Planctomycetota bacterium]